MKNTQKSQPGMMVLIFILAIMSCTLLVSQQIISHYSLMQYTRLISEERFGTGHPPVIVLPLAGKESTSGIFDRRTAYIKPIAYSGV
jgi:hypothetical protein